MTTTKDKLDTINFCDNVKALFSTNNIVEASIEKQKFEFVKILSSDKILSILKDDEMMSTINAFFDNSLNISQTSKQAYMHRNTLIYRLEKVRKSTGLNLKNFDDSVIFANIITIYRKLF